MVHTHVLCTPAGEKSLIQLAASPVCVPRVFGLRSASVDFFLSFLSARIPWHAERNLLELFALRDVRVFMVCVGHVWTNKTRSHNHVVHYTRENCIIINLQGII